MSGQPDLVTRQVVTTTGIPHIASNASQSQRSRKVITVIQLIECYEGVPVDSEVFLDFDELSDNLIRTAAPEYRAYVMERLRAGDPRVVIPNGGYVDTYTVSS